MHGLDPIFGGEFAIVLALFLLLFIIFNIFMSKCLKVERKKFFSYNFVNEKHKKVDWTIRIFFIIIFLIVLVLMANNPMERNWGVIPSYIMFALIIVSEIARAVMEWKYAENKRAYILTISQLGIIVLFLIAMFTTDFFGFL